jgi:5-hydroxyisourate hydrolase
MGRLTTHVLDTARGCPGAGIAVELYRLDGGRRKVAQALTNDEGRVDAPLLAGTAFVTGRYELVFAIGTYFANAASTASAAEAPFLDDVVLRFSLARDEHYHVPLLVSPWSYTTYRGS